MKIKMERDSYEDGPNIYDDVHKVRRKRQKVLIREMLYDYATNTTLHGLPYTTRRGFTVIEKLFWIVTFISSICLGSYLIYNTWIKWKTSPVLVSISETLVPVGDVPFPSVTICPQLKIKRSVFDYAAEDQRLKSILNSPTVFATKDNFRAYVKVDDLSLVCSDRRMYQQLKGNDLLHQLAPSFRRFLFTTKPTPATENIISVAPKKEDIFVSCNWRGLTDINCTQTVSEIITSEGLCYNFNSLAARDILKDENTLYFKATNEAVNWTMNEGYTSFGPEVYPVAGKALDSSPDLEIIFRDNLSEHGKGCDTINHGFFKVYVQHPADLPQSSQYYYAVRNGEVSSMALSFNKINTAEAVKKYSADIRQCYFPGEFNLKNFNIYSASNCMIECLANITYEKCKCVGFYMPRQNITKICDFVEYDCMHSAREQFVYSEAHKDNKTCNCLPSCQSVEYQAEILKTGFDFQNFLEHYNIADDKNVSYSKLEMFYKGPRFVSMHRSELFGTTDFMANIGGLLSLFLGFSFLSLVELFYYLTLRLCCILNKDLKQEKIERRDTIKRHPSKY